jgi:4-hydroxybenzoate polyprenyltransferase
MGSEPTPASPFGRPGQDRLSTWYRAGWACSSVALSVLAVVAGYALDDLPGFILGLTVVVVFWAREAWGVLRTRSDR